MYHAHHSIEKRKQIGIMLQIFRKSIIGIAKTVLLQSHCGSYFCIISHKSENFNHNKFNDCILFKWHFGGCLTIQAHRFAVRSSTRQTTHLNSDKKVNSKPSETGRSPLNRLANRPVILRSSAYFEFLCLFFLPSVFCCVLFRAAFSCAVLFTAAKTIFQSFSSMTLLPENIKNPRKTYFNPFTLFHRRMI